MDKETLLSPNSPLQQSVIFWRSVSISRTPKPETDLLPQVPRCRFLELCYECQFRGNESGTLRALSYEPRRGRLFEYLEALLRPEHGKSATDRMKASLTLKGSMIRRPLCWIHFAVTTVRLRSNGEIKEKRRRPESKACRMLGPGSKKERRRAP